MKSIDEALREKEMQIVILEREIKILRAATKIVGNGSRQSTSDRGGDVMSQPQMIREVLLKHGRPVHADQIAEGIEKRFNVKLKRAEITSVIYRAIRGNKFFRKEGTNTFGLRDWPSGRRRRSKN
jgi:HB1/ASXL restriction endonuclease-like protein with HTH domain